MISTNINEGGCNTWLPEVNKAWLEHILAQSEYSLVTGPPAAAADDIQGYHDT